MKKKDNDIINENSINDLIQYAEDEESNTSEIMEALTQNTQEEKNSEEGAESQFPTEAEESVQEIVSSEEYEDDLYDYYDSDETIYEDKSSSKKGIIIGIIIGIAAIIAFISIDSGIIGNYKNNFSNNFTKIFGHMKNDKQLPEETPAPDAQYKPEIKSNTIVSFDEANKTEFEAYKNGVVCAKMNHMSFIDETGAVAWETNTAIVNPILRTEGDYILLAEKGGNKICLYNANKLLYDTDDPDSIMTAHLSSEGDVVVVTNKSSYKGGISVYNKSGTQIFSWASGSDTVISADISASSRRVAVALLNTDNTASSIIQLFDVNETESYAKVTINDTVVFDVSFSGDIINAFGDNRLTGISASGKVIYDNTFENVQLTHSAIDEKGNKLLSFDDGNIPMISRYSKRGSLKESAVLTGVTDYIDINGNDIIYNIGRDIYFGQINSKTMHKYTATMDIKNLLIVSDSIYVIVYSNSIEVVKI